MIKLETDIIKRWIETLESADGVDAFLNFAEHLNINEFTKENGARRVYFEDGNDYTAHAYYIDESESDEEKVIIETLADCGIDF